MTSFSNAHADSAAVCLRDAQAEIAAEFELDQQTNTFGKPLPEWAAKVRDLVHAAQEHLINAAEMDRSAVAQ